MVVHLKRNMSSIKQTWRAGSIHQRQRGLAIGFSFDVTNAGPPLWGQGCRSIEIIILMWPFISHPGSLHYSLRTDLMVLREGVKDLDCISYSPNLSVYGPSPLGIKVIWASQTLEKRHYAKDILYMKKLNLHSIIVFCLMV